MRILTCLLLFLCCAPALPAQITLTGKVLDAEDGQPLHFATVAVVGQPYGTLTQAGGSFVLSLPETLPPNSGIIVTYLGYEAAALRLADFKTAEKIMLSPAGVGLPTISVAASGDLTEIELGRKERKAYTFYQTNNDQTYQLATRVLNPAQRPGVIGEVRYYFGNAAKGGKNVRLNFYAVDPACDCPGAPLHATSVIPEKNKSKWNKVDLSSYQVELPAGDFFVAFEWLGPGAEKTGRLDFSIGMVPMGNAPKIYEKLGGTAWKEAVARGAYRPLVRLTAKVVD
jgi:hypothetical protein